MRGERGDSFVIAGAGGYGCELALACRAVGREPLCFVDDGNPDQVRIAATGLPLEGTVDDAAWLAPWFLVGVGYPVPRRAVTTRLVDLGLTPSAPVVHPSAVLMGVDKIDLGSVVFPNVTISRGARIGEHVLINYNASVGHDTTIDDGTTISPGAQVGGECFVGAGVLIGSGAVVLQGLKIGDGAIVGSGAVVTSDVEPRQTVVGVPARAR